MKFVDHVFDDQVIDHLTVKIILPEGSTYEMRFSLCCLFCFTFALWGSVAVSKWVSVLSK